MNENYCRCLFVFSPAFSSFSLNLFFLRKEFFEIPRTDISRMINNFSIFTRSGLVLWSKSTSPIKGNPINSLIQNVFLEEKSAQVSYQYENYILKWTFSNKFDLIFVAVYLNLTNLFYINDLLEAVKEQFCAMFHVSFQ